MTDLPKTSAPAQRALDGAGVRTLEDLASRSEKEIAALHGMGPKALRILREELAGLGLAMRP
ncbi:helix-hairpin-helix domain-containing protein [Actinocorallia longicatena]|uniref:DNA-binding protein n=1 Tax=Actinocorallia longicatena TaxID=111803 RepID=A0ABP6QE24_9ACTN